MPPVYLPEFFIRLSVKTECNVALGGDEMPYLLSSPAGPRSTHNKFHKSLHRSRTRSAEDSSTELARRAIAAQSDEIHRKSFTKRVSSVWCEMREGFHDSDKAR